MNIDKRWFLLLTVAASAAAGAVVALKAHRRRHRTAHERQHTAALTSWENEGGNVAPTQVAAASR
jgi:hypothetical protein